MTKNKEVGEQSLDVWVLYLLDYENSKIVKIFSSLESGVEWFLHTYNPDNYWDWKLHVDNPNEVWFENENGDIYTLDRWSVDK